MIMDMNYEEYWANNKVMTGSAYDLWKKKVLYNLPLKGKNYFDLGCGDGDIAAYFIDEYTVYGADISQTGLQSAKEKGIITRCLDANKPLLPYENAFFDNISCLDVLEHIIDPEGITLEMYRCLKIDGTLIVCVPNILNIFNRLYFLGGEFVDVMDVAHRSGSLFSEHIRLFSKRKLETLLSKAGFTITGRHYYFPDRFNEPKWQRFQFLGSLINKSQIVYRLPALFALGFLFTCKKSTNKENL